MPSTRIGADSGSTGTVTVNGLGSTWTASQNLNVGGSGLGVLKITGGAAVSSQYGTVAGNSGNTVTVDGTGSSWTNSSWLNVGGTLKITRGATVSNTSGTAAGSRLHGHCYRQRRTD